MFAKRLTTMQKNVGTKASPNVTFVKSLATLKRIVGTRNGSKQSFMKKKEEERKEILFFASNSDASTKINEWYVDSGCSNHMTGDEKTFLSINDRITTKGNIGNGALVDAKCKGTISINMKGCSKQIHDVLYVSDLEKNLLSVGQLMENGYSLVFRDNYCKIYDKVELNQVIVEVKMIKRNFPLQFHYNALKMKL